MASAGPPSTPTADSSTPIPWLSRSKQAARRLDPWAWPRSTSRRSKHGRWRSQPAGAEPFSTKHCASGRLKERRSAHAAADAHGDDAVLAAAPLQLAQQRAGHARARDAERVTERDGSAVGVD